MLDSPTGVQATRGAAGRAGEECPGVQAAGKAGSFSQAGATDPITEGLSTKLTGFSSH